MIAVLDRSPFYGESGGQVGDTGEIVGDGLRFHVTDTHEGRRADPAPRTRGRRGTPHRDDGLSPRSTSLGDRRSAAHTRRRISCTTRCRRTSVRTRSSRAPRWTTIGCGSTSPTWRPSPPSSWTASNTTPIERVAAAEPVSAQIVPLAEARAAGAMMLFGEKYPDPVRMVSMGEFSRELCGGTHLDNTRDIGSLEIIREEGVAAGTRRIVALTGNKAEQHIDRVRTSLEATAKVLAVRVLDVPAAVRQLMQTVRDLRKQLAAGVSRGEDGRCREKSGGRLSQRTDLRPDARGPARRGPRAERLAV